MTARTSRRSERAAARDDHLGAGQFRALAVGDLLADEARQTGIAAPAHVLDRGRAALGLGLVEGGAAHGDDQLGIGGFDGGDGVAGIDRTGEGLVAFDREDVGDLHHVEQRGDARRDVLAGGGRGRDEGVVSRHQRPPAARRSRPAGWHRRHRRPEHLAHAGDLGGLSATARAMAPATSTVTSPSLPRRSLPAASRPSSRHCRVRPRRAFSSCILRQGLRRCPAP